MKKFEVETPAPAGGEDGPLSRRGDLDLIIGLVPYGAKVLDLGCGDGLLLERLRREKGTDGRGVERDSRAVIACMRRGIPVIQGDLDEGLADFPDKSFDVVVISHTLQQVNQPRALLLEAGRVGRQVIVGFPNFGYWRIRLSLLFQGRMPKSTILPYEWYVTPNIHLLTLTDFEIFCRQEGFGICRRLGLRHPSWKSVSLLPGVRAAYALYLLDAAAVHAPRPATEPASADSEPIQVVEE